MNTSFFGELLQTISERGRGFLKRERRGQDPVRSESLLELCEDLLSGRGEASGVALAREILSRYAELRTGPRVAFFEALAQRFGPEPERMEPPYHLGKCLAWDFDGPVVQRHYPQFAGWQPLKRRPKPGRE